MKTTWFSLVVALLLLGASPALQAEENGLPGAQGGGAVSCAVEDGTGAAVANVQALSQGDPAYWFQYNSGGEASSSVLFLALPLVAASPHRVIIQSFNPGASPTTNIITPFGVPFWGGDLTSGPWILVVRNNDTGSSAVCPFTVVP